MKIWVHILHVVVSDLRIKQLTKWPALFFFFFFGGGGGGGGGVSLHSKDIVCNLVVHDLDYLCDA